MADAQEAPTLVAQPFSSPAVGGELENVIVRRLRRKLELANRIRKFADFDRLKELGTVRIEVGGDSVACGVAWAV